MLRTSRVRFLPFLDFVIVAAIVLAFMWTAEWKGTHPMSLTWLRGDFTDHLGAEYDCIAKAIRSGRGFSDPFQEPTGPTAWMPPALPYLQAFVYWLCNDEREIVIAVMLRLQNVAVLLTGCIVVGQARKRKMVSLGFIIFISGCAANFFDLFQTIHDSGWLLLLVSILWLGLVYFWKGAAASYPQASLWGCFGGLCALSSPVLGAVWATITSLRTWFDGGDLSAKRRWAILLIVASVSIIVVTPWTIRNRVVFGKWLPIKSNGMYEVWQSQCPDDDGVLDVFQISQHPWPNQGEQRHQYKDLGESAFIAEKGTIAIQSIASNPLEFSRRVANRWGAVCVYYFAAYTFDEKLGGGWPIFFKRIVFPLPMLCLLVLLYLKSGPLEPEVFAAIAIWALGLLPYLLVSYVDRYATPVFGMKMLIVLYGFHAIGNRGR